MKFAVYVNLRLPTNHHMKPGETDSHFLNKSSYMYGVTLDNRPKCDAHIADIFHKVSALNS